MKTTFPNTNIIENFVESLIKETERKIAGIKYELWLGENYANHLTEGRKKRLQKQVIKLEAKLKEYKGA